MASYAVRLYQNTGFNGVNIPDTPARLNACAYIDVDSVEILQDRGLDHIDVNATWDQVENCDYVKVGSWYYSVPSGGIQMLSEDVARLSLLSDPLTSAGGFSVASDGTVTTKFDILDGVTQRCTVSDDSWGKYTNSDPLIVPQEPLQIETEWLNTSVDEDSDHIYTETTIDLITTMGQRTGTTYTDDKTGETVTVPQTYPTLDLTSYSLDGAQIQSAYTRVYDRTDTTQVSGASGTAKSNIASGLQYINSLGVAQGSVLSQWKVPSKFASETKSNPGTTVGTTAVEYTDQIVSNISGVSGSLSSTISPDYATVDNKRLLYGEYNKYGMITCAGSSAEFKPEDLGGETAPSISYKSDPRPSGKPYYRFTTINGDTDFWRNSIAGSPWENVPLVYQGASGSALTRLNFDNDRKLKELDKTQYEDRYALQQLQAGGQAAMGAAGLVGSIASGNVAGAVSSGSEMLGGLNSVMTNAQNKQQYEAQYKAQKANELSQLYQSTEIYAPTVTFPYNADILRDVKGNGVCVYKYHMSDNDTARCDKLLTMYGYQTAEALTTAHFGRRQYFDYVACSTVSITGLPKWWCDEIATQLKVGVRVWHTLPDNSYYTNNPIRS